MMGQACSQAFAMAGYEVRLQSLDDELFRGVLDRIRHDLAFLAERGVGSPDDVDRTASLITTTSDLARSAGWRRLRPGVHLREPRGQAGALPADGGAGRSRR